MGNIKTKEQIFRDGFSLFVCKEIPIKIFNEYMNDKDGSGAFELQCWVVSNMKDEIVEWATGIGVIDAVELLYQSAVDNGNI